MDNFVLHLGKQGECTVYTGSRYRSGYGRMGRKGKQHSTHRWVWEKMHGPIPEGLEIDHLCRNRACVNLLHLELVTRRENVRRGESCIAKHMERSDCIHGHGPLKKAKNGRRYCYLCWAEYRRRWRERGGST